jgi:hypothetical protein
MKRFVLVVAMLGLLGVAQPAAAVDPGPVHQCGTFVSYRAADSTRSGELVIGSTTYATSSGNPAPFRQVIEPGATIGSQVCLDGTVVASQTTANLLTDFTVSPANCNSSVGPGIPPPSSVPSGIGGFHASWYGQSGYPTLCPGQTSTATVAYYNSGSRGWVSARMGEMAFLGTWRPEPGQDQPSPLGGDGTNGSPVTGWPRYNRVAAQPADYVGPNQVSWFQFTIKAPATTGTYKLYIRPVIEGATWMEDYGVFWQITVIAPTTPPPPATSGTRTVTVGAPNTADDSFTDSTASATYRYDSNDVYRYGGTSITMAQFEQALTSGDVIAATYNADAASASTFDITTDLGQGAPTVSANVEGEGTAQRNVRLAITEPSSNLDGLSYSIQRASSTRAPMVCDATENYAQIATLTIPSGSNTGSYLDPANLPNGQYCYRVGAPNPVNGTTAWGYSNMAILANPIGP